MKVKIKPIGIGAFVTVTKGLLKGLEDLEVGGQVETPNTVGAGNSLRHGSLRSKECQPWVTRKTKRTRPQESVRIPLNIADKSVARLLGHSHYLRSPRHFGVISDSASQIVL